MWNNWPARKLPEINVAGTAFYLDLRLWELREVNDFSNKFSLNDLYDLPNGGFICCFDLKTKNLFQGTQEEYDVRKHELKVVRLPSIKKMDPVGWRVLEGLPPKKEMQPLLEKKKIKISKGKKL
jgi:hypothetical protein